MGTPQEEAHWVLRAQLGEREAVERLLDSVQRPLRRYLATLASAADADDILQDVLLIVFRKLIWLDNPELFLPWAFRIASLSLPNAATHPSVAALTFLIAWVGFAIILIVIRTGTRVLRAIELMARTSQ